ncbi:MAG: hypothetical protein LBP33_03005 [Candidatus Adiutrix sp.]|jgi:hypothetical protein|nr:hypothetical protein [Candidatus Adiutrix sp.]
MIILSIDTDWAPEAATRAVLEKVRALGLKVTVFFSTPSPTPYWPELEPGCHPDLSRRRTAAEDARPLTGMATLEHDLEVDRAEGQILAAYRRAFPEARALRTHRFYWHSDLSRNLAGHGFWHDSSMILPYHPGLKGFQVGRLKRWPVWASDHLHLARSFPLDRLAMPHLNDPGLKIFCFHVAYLYLNAVSLNDFNMVKQRLADEDWRPPAGRGPGVWNLFELLAEKVYRRSGGCWLSDLPPEMIVKNKELDDEDSVPGI